MRRKIISFILIFCIAISLASCTAPTNSVPSASIAPLRFLSSGEVLGSGNENGYYYLSFTANTSYLLRYVDYATLQDTPLCSQPNCTHSDETCPAWFAYCGNMANLYVIDHSLYILYSGAPWDASASKLYGEKACPRLIRCALDGTGQQQITQLSSTDAIVSPPATDGTSLYTLVTSYANAEGNGETKPLTIDLGTGKATLGKAIPRRDIRILGAAERTLLMECAGGSGLMSYFTFNVDSTKQQDIYTSSTPTQGICNGDDFYILDREIGTLKKHSLITGEETLLAHDLAAEENPEWLTLKYVLSQGCVITFEDSEGVWRTLLIDQTTGAVTEQTLQAESPDPHDKMRVLNVFAQQDDRLLVSPRRSFRTIAVPSSDGTSVYEISELDFSLAFISLQDFWNSTPNYLEITKVE